MDCHEIDLLDYLKGNPNPQQNQLVLNHLDECPRCRERLQVLVAVEAGSNRRPGVAPRGLLIAAACLFLALLVSVLYPLYFQTPEPASLATTTPFQEFPLEVRNADEVSPARHAMELYRGGRYEEAAENFEDRSNESPRFIFYAGVSHYLAGNYNSAVNQLTRSSVDPSWREPSLWYLANAHLHLDQLKRAREILLQLEGSNSQYADEATRLLHQLGRISQEREERQ